VSNSTDEPSDFVGAAPKPVIRVSSSKALSEVSSERFLRVHVPIFCTPTQKGRGVQVPTLLQVGFLI